MGGANFGYTSHSEGGTTIAETGYFARADFQRITESDEVIYIPAGERMNSEQFQSTKSTVTLLGLAPLLAAALLLCDKASSIVILFGRAIHSEFLVGAAAGGLACCIALAALLRRRTSLEQPLAITAIALVSCTLAALGLVSYTTLIPFYVHDAIAGASGALFGVGSLGLAVLWGRLYAQRNRTAALRTAGFAVAAATILYTLASLAPAPWQIIFAVALVVASTFLFLASTYPLSATPANDATSPVRFSVKQIALPLWRALAGTFLCAFIFGLVWDPSLAFLSEESATTRWEMLLGGLLVCAFVELVIARVKDGSTPHVLNAFGLPIMAAALLVIPSLEIAGADLWNAILGVLNQACFILAFTTLWVICCEAAHRTPSASTALFSIALLAPSAGVLAGTLLIPYLGTTGKTVALVALAVYLAASAFSWTKEGTKQVSTNETTAQPADDVQNNAASTSPTHFQQRCLEIAGEAKLSPRETEVFLYLARGHSQVFVAQELVVSENTVRTHVRNIYRKLGVSSKEELLSCIEIA